MFHVCVCPSAWLACLCGPSRARAVRRRCLCASAWLVCLCGLSAWADGEDAEPSADQPPDHYEEVVVTAHPLSDTGLAQPAQVLAGAALDRARGANIGATVERLPGVRLSSFGEAAGRPVIHGLAGARVRMLEDRSDTLDVSVTSSDHMVTVESFVAERVEVLKGPSTLLYGSGAIGGVVNVETGRIATTVPDDSFGARLEVRGNDNGDGTAAALRMDGAVGRLVWHVDGFRRRAEDYAIPGFAESSRLMAQEAAERDAEDHDDDGDDHHEDGDEDGDDHHEDGDEDEHEDEAPAHGRLPGSDYTVRGAAAGLSFVGERGFAGISFSRMDSDYGLPGGHEHGHEEAEDEHEAAEDEHHEDEAEHGEEGGNAWLDMKQQRVSVEFGLDAPFGNFDSLSARIGYNDYEHAEIEPNGEVGTTFANDAYDGRIELRQDAAGAWRNAYGLHLVRREFSALGEEAFVPPVDSSSTALFWAGERGLGALQLESGLRLERMSHEPSARASGPRRSFTAYAASAGIIAPVSDAWRLSLLGDLSSRAPIAEELYSNGAHLATRNFELGDPSLDPEQAASLSAKAEYQSERIVARATAYRRHFRDFIHQTFTGDEQDGLTVLRFAQADATFTGLDFEATFHVWERGDWHGDLRFMFDVVAAELDVDGNDNLPRIPPSRAGFGFDVDNGRFFAGIDYLRSASQDDVAPLELPTDAYEDLRFDASYRFSAGRSNISFFVQGRNLTDDEQRDHVSFIKDLAPRPGRTLEAGIRVSL